MADELPFRRLKIMGKWYDLRPGRVAKPNVLGECDAHECVIGYNIDQDEQQLADTLIHEATHAHRFGLGLSIQERNVRLSATGFVQLLADNLDFAKWLVSILEERANAA